MSTAQTVAFSLILIAPLVNAQNQSQALLAVPKNFSISLRYVSGNSSGRIYKMVCAAESQIGQATNEVDLKLASVPSKEACARVRNFLHNHATDLQREASLKIHPRPQGPHAPWANLSVLGMTFGINPSPEVLCADIAFKHCTPAKLTHAESLALLLKEIITARLGRLAPAPREGNLE